MRNAQDNKKIPKHLKPEIHNPKQILIVKIPNIKIVGEL